LASLEKALGPEHPDFATSLDNPANLYRVTGRYAEAEPLYRRALAILEGSVPVVTQIGRRSARATLPSSTGLAAPARPPGSAPASSRR
jgi:Tetratricopeptide repeat